MLARCINNTNVTGITKGTRYVVEDDLDPTYIGITNDNGESVFYKRRHFHFIITA